MNQQYKEGVERTAVRSRSRSSVVSRRAVSYLSWCLLMSFVLLSWRRSREVPLDVIQLYVELDAKLQTTGGDKQACRLPSLNPWDPSVLKYYEKQDDSWNCKDVQGRNVSFIDDSGNLVLDVDPLISKGHTDVACRYREFTHNDGVDDESAKYGEWQPIKNTERKQLVEDFVLVECTEGRLNRNIYSIFLSHVSPVGKFALKAPQLEDEDHLSLFFFGLDSMSRLNFLRQLPKTYKYLADERQAFVFQGHTKVGDNTMQNMVPIFTGKICCPWTHEFKGEIYDKWGQFYDTWTEYIWQKYAAKGYATLYAEDRPDINLFNYLGYMFGFKFQPVNHYFRTFWTQVYGSMAFKSSSSFCYDTLPEHVIQLEYVKSFMAKYDGKRKYTFSWLMGLSHDHLNIVGKMDADLLRYFKEFEKMSNRTITMVMSDHGNRYASIRESVLGRIEARMPFLAVIVPEWFRKKYPKIVRNLERNTERLTAQYDVYETTMDILNGAFRDIDDKSVPTFNRKNISLFRPIGAERTCHQAAVPKEYCSCYQELVLSADHHLALKAANILLGKVNAMLDKEGGKCARLSLKKITYASVFLPHQGTIHEEQTKFRVPSEGYYVNYRVALIAAPSDAQIESLLRHNFDTNSYEIEGQIDRNNKYGNTSACSDDRELRKFCYCI